MTDSRPKYLSFRVEDEEYAVDILRVKEIRRWEEVTRLPNSPDYVRGVVNVRGEIMPLLCLRRRFGLEPREPNARTVVVALTTGAGQTRGVIVDGVCDVHAVGPDEVQPAPDLAGTTAAGCVAGLVAIGEGRLVLLDVDRLVAPQGEEP